ncbi:MAG: 3,4-dihydroxy-2-butanone-4-phosphate synthase [Planctomycetes bacterium]|nr:3,4-dihydroxy-2-butanone-4-phosphate synthase [Planctomycetota bacterium]
MAFSSVPEILEEIRAGRPIVLVDAEDRENEGDLVVAAQRITPDVVNFMITAGRGIVCLALDRARADRLELPLMVQHNTSSLGTAFTVSIDAREGTTTGVSAADRATTIRKALDPDCRPGDLSRPGHVFPLRARDGGVLVRAGQTEGSVDLARLAGLEPAGVICEILKPDGTMARVPELVEFTRKHRLKMCTVDQIIRYRIEIGDGVARHQTTVNLPLRQGRFEAHLFVSEVDGNAHLAVTMGLPSPGFSANGKSVIQEPVLVRMHSECLTGDVFGSQRCDCGAQKERALELIAAEGRGVLLYLRQEGRGIGLSSKLKAYALQEHGLDTVEANERLGFPPDARHYGIGTQILYQLGIRRVRLLTNNPKKAESLAAQGIEVVERIPLEIKANGLNDSYLRTKRSKLGHLLSDEVFQ